MLCTEGRTSPSGFRNVPPTSRWNDYEITWEFEVPARVVNSLGWLLGGFERKLSFDLGSTHRETYRRLKKADGRTYSFALILEEGTRP